MLRSRNHQLRKQPPRGASAERRDSRCRRLTDKPFGVNITLLPVGVPPDYEGIVRVIIEEGVKIVETADAFSGCDQAQKGGYHGSRGAIRHALSAARLVDMISMDGFDCGGQVRRMLKLPF